jgi:hypothetical protein
MKKYYYGSKKFPIEATVRVRKARYARHAQAGLEGVVKRVDPMTPHLIHVLIGKTIFTINGKYLDVIELPPALPMTPEPEGLAQSFDEGYKRLQEKDPTFKRFIKAETTSTRSAKKFFRKNKNAEVF